jgi:hypothetical protein
MWMPHSDGLYSPLDPPKPSLSDLDGCTKLAGSSIASAADGLARAHMNDDSVEMDISLAHMDSDWKVTSVC